MKQFFFIFLSLLATSWAYSFAQSDHLEHLPVLYRLLDENYLPNDNFINENLQGYNPRRLFFLLLQPFCKLLGVETVYFCGCWLCNFLLARVSYLLANELFSYQKITDSLGLWAALFVLTLSVFGLGESPHLRANFFVPSAVGALIVCYSIYWGIKSQFLRLGLILGLGAFIHPLLCPLSGAIWFFWLIIYHFYRYQFYFLAYKRLFWGFFAWLIISVGVIAPYYYQNFAADKLSGQEFALIYAHFRCPHHFLPSFFWPQEQNIALAWLALLLFWFAKGYKFQIVGRRELFLLAGVSATLILLLPLGYYWVELYPSRLWATVQVFRFLFIIKWLVLLFAYRVTQSVPRIPLLILLLDPLILLAAELFLALFARWRYAYRAIWLFVGWAAYAIYPQLGKNADVYLYIFALGASAGFIHYYYNKSRLYFGWFMGCIGLFMGYYLLTPRQIGYEFIQKACSYQFSIPQIPSDKQNIAIFVAENTPDTARLLTPPNFAELRLTASRSIIIDFKTFPFEDIALKRWHTQIMDIYGYTDKLGFEAVRWAFVPNYLYSTDTQLNEKAKKYNADFIILYAQTPTLQPILYQDSLYKLIKRF